MEGFTQQERANQFLKDENIGRVVHRDGRRTCREMASVRKQNWENKCRARKPSSPELSLVGVIRKDRNGIEESGGFVDSCFM